MNKLPRPYLLTLLAALSFTVSAATPKPSLNSPLAAKSLLTDIVKTPEGWVAAGSRGHVLLSQNGDDWQQASVPVNVLLTDVFFLDGKLGWAVGHDATIIHSTDGGKNWQVQQYAPELDKPLFGVHFKDAQNGLAFGAYGMFFRTSDGGKQWQKVFHDELLHPDDVEYLADLKQDDPEAYEDETAFLLPHFNRVLIEGERAWLAGEQGLLAASSDYGDTWHKVEPFYNGSFFDVARGNGQQLYVAGLRGNVFSGMDSNLDGFAKVDIPAGTSINRVVSVGNKLVLVGNSGVLLTSHDGGKTLQNHLQSDGKAITGAVIDGERLILTSEVGIKVLGKGQW